MDTIPRQVSRFATVSFLTIVVIFTELFDHIRCFFSLIIQRFQSNSPAFSRHFKGPKFERTELAHFLQNRTNSDEYVRIVEKIDAACSTGAGDQYDVAFRLCIKPDSYPL